MKRFYVMTETRLVFLIAFAMFLFSPPTSAQPKASKPTIAVTTFENLSAYPENAWVAMSFSESLTANLSRLYERFRVIERIRIYEVIKEKGFDPEKISNIEASKHKDMGNLIGANYLILGSVSLQGNAEDMKTPLLVAMRTVDVGTGEIKEAQSIRGQMEQLFDLEIQLAMSLLKQMGIEPTPEEAEKLNLKGTLSILANKYYSLGQMAFYQGDYETAKTLYDKAMETVKGSYYQEADLSLIETLEIQKATVDTAQKELVKAEARKRRDERKQQVTEAYKMLFSQAKYSMIAEEYESAIESFQQYLDLARPFRQIKWKKDLNEYREKYPYPPLFHKDTIYEALLRVEPGGTFYCLRAIVQETGETRWKFEQKVPNQLPQEFPCANSITVGNGIVVAPSEKTHLLAVDIQKGNLLWEYNTNKHQDIRKANHAEDAEWPIPELKNGLVYLKSEDGMFTALDTRTGKVCWQFETGIFSFKPPLITESKVYIQSGNGLLALDAYTGKLLWETPMLVIREMMTEPIALTLQADTLYVANRCNDTLYALNATTGKVIWQIRNPEVRNTYEIKADTEHVYILSGYFQLYSSGRRIRTIENSAWDSGTISVFSNTGEPLCKVTNSGLPILANDTLYMKVFGNATEINGRLISENQDAIVALSATTGEILWQESNPSNENPVYPIYVAKTTVYCANPGVSMFYAFDVKTGEILWHLPICAGFFVGESSVLTFCSNKQLFALYPKPKGLSPEQEAYSSLLGIGTAQVVLGRYEEAVSSLKSALELRQDLSEAHWQLMKAYCGLKQWEQSAASRNDYLALVPYEKSSPDVKKYLWEQMGIRWWIRQGYYTLVTDKRVFIGAYPFEPGTGKKLWQRSDIPNFLEIKAVTEREVYYLHNAFVNCRSLETGDSLWQRISINEPLSSSESGWAQTFAIANGQLYIELVTNNEVKSSEKKDKSSITSTLYAINALTGETCWVFSVDRGISPPDDKYQPHQIHLSESPLVVTDLVYWSIKGCLYALNPKTGTIQWQFEDTLSKSTSDKMSLSVSEGKVYVETAKQLYALDAQTGKLIWSLPIEGLFPGTPFYVSQGRIYLLAYENIPASEKGIRSSRRLDGKWIGYLYAIRTDNGKIEWLLKISFATWSEYGIDCFFDDDIIYLKPYDALYVVSAETGKTLWQFQYWGKRFTIGEKTVYAWGEDRFFALDKAKGTIKWRDDGLHLFSFTNFLKSRDLYRSESNGFAYLLNAGDVLCAFDLTQIDNLLNMGKRWWTEPTLYQRAPLIEYIDSRPASSYSTKPISITELGAKLLVSGSFKADWSPDGSQIAFGKMGGSIHILTFATGDIRQLTQAGADPSWSPDGRFIAYAYTPFREFYEDEEIWLMEATGGTSRKLADGGFPSWSPDGRSVIYHSRKENKMYSINIYDPDAKPIIYFERPPGWYPAISPDGKRIAFGAPNQLIIFDRETGEIVATLPTEGRGLLLCWSPDGTKIAFGGFGSYGLWIFDMSKNKTIQIAEGYYTMPAWSKDGTKLAFDLRTSPEWSIWIIETDKLQGILNTE